MLVAMICCMLFPCFLIYSMASIRPILVHNTLVTEDDTYVFLLICKTLPISTHGTTIGDFRAPLAAHMRFEYRSPSRYLHYV